MSISRACVLFVASFVFAAPLSATAEQTIPQDEILQCTEADVGSEGLESGEFMSTDDEEGGECRALLESCSRNSQCCANLCVLGLCL
jgi:hypothetical protein